MKIKLSINKAIINKNQNFAGMGTVDGYHEMSVINFINKVVKKGYAWCGPEFEGNKRTKKAYIRSELIGIDIDTGWRLEDVFKDTFTFNNALLLYTSPSHTAEVHKFRIVFKLKKPYTEYSQIEQVIKKLITYYRSDKSCSDCTRFFYGNDKAKVKLFGKVFREAPEPQVIKSGNDISLSLEYQLKTLATLREMLISIKSKHKELEYNPWLMLCSSIWMFFTYEESIDLLQKYYPEEGDEGYKYKYNHRLSTIPYTYIIRLAVKCGFQLPDINYPDFVRVNDDGEFSIPSVSIVDYLISKNFFTFFPDEQNPNLYQVIKEDNNVLTETGVKITCEQLQNHIIKNYPPGDAEYLRTRLMKLNINKVFTFLHSPNTYIHKDSREACFLYFRNGFLEVKKDNMIFHESYKDLDNFKIWKKGINDRNLELDYSQSEFEQFLFNVSNKDREHFDLLCSVIGYLLHRYKDPHITKCVIFTDEVIDIDNPSGRTGKSLIMKAISEVRNVLDEPGRTFDITKTFCWQNVELSTEIIHLDDIPPSFHLKHFYPNITGNLKVEEKGLKSYILNFKKSPKFAFTSNYTVDTGGGSDRARVVEIALHNYYNEYFQPMHEFGHRFFDDWNGDEWNRFYTFMATCVQKYFNMGLLHTVSEALMRNKIVKQTSEIFAEWVLNFDFYPKSGKDFFSHTGLYDNYMRFTQDALDADPLSHKKFTVYLKTYFNIVEIKYKIKTINRLGNVARGIQIFGR